MTAELTWSQNTRLEGFNVLELKPDENHVPKYHIGSTLTSCSCFTTHVLLLLQTRHANLLVKLIFFHQLLFCCLDLDPMSCYVWYMLL